MSDDLNYVVPFEPPPEETPPPKLNGAPPWAQVISDKLHTMEMRQQADRHRLGGGLFTLQGQLLDMNKKLGEEPDSDGKGGKGLIGDVRKMGRDLSGLMDLRNKGVGFVVAVGLLGAVLIAGLIHLVQGVAHGKP